MTEGAMRALAFKILDNSHHFTWTLQGLGMLRTYLTDDRTVRLHVWDDRYAVPGVSEMHTHPWDMTSSVVIGEVRNVKYVAYHDAPDRYMQQTILCGEGGGLEGEPIEIGLEPRSSIVYQSGESYTQYSHEVHVSRPSRGTVTVVEREFGSDVDHAYVYWSKGEEWVSAEPRQAMPDEVYDICHNALKRF